MNQLRLIFALHLCVAQIPTASPMHGRLPKGTVIHGNIPYNKDTLKNNLLDIYLPANAKEKVLSGGIHLIAIIQSVGWMDNDKLANNGFAIAPIYCDFTQNTIFTAILQDYN
jgi:hypothetical protein